MSFGHYLSYLFNRKLLVESEESTSAIDTAKKFAENVGGDPADQNDLASAFESIEKSLDQVELDYFENPQNEGLAALFEILVEKNRLDFVQKYAETKEKVLISVLEDLEKLDVAENSSKYLKLNQTYFTVSGRLLKLYQLLDGQVGGLRQEEPKPEEGPVNEAVTLDDATKNKIDSILSILKRGMSHMDRLSTIEQNRIERAPEDEKGESLIDLLTDLHKELGVFNKLQGEASKKKERIKQKSPVEDASVKKKKRIASRIIRAISLARLPGISNGEIDSPGDYYKLYKALEKESPRWMEDSLNRYVFGNNAESLAEFKARAAQQESPKEEDQLTYLAASRSWCLTYIKTERNGKLNDRDENNLVTSLENTAREKEKEIKNYYLAREFNLGNFGGIQLKPEIRLPLYTTVKLPVTEADRLKESPLRNILKGLGSIIKGLFSAIQDTGNETFAQAARQRNIAVFNGVNSIIRGAVTLVGGKQAGRDYAKRVPNIGDTESKVKEDMVAPIAPQAPGQFMQTPDAMAGSMDTYSLLGPGKKEEPKKKKKKKSDQIFTRVSSFSDFVNSK